MAHLIPELTVEQLITLQHLYAGEIQIGSPKGGHEKGIEGYLQDLEQLSLVRHHPSEPSRWCITTKGNLRLAHLAPVESARLRYSQLCAIPKSQRSKDEDRYLQIFAILLVLRDDPESNNLQDRVIDAAIVAFLGSEQLQFQFQNPDDR